MTDYSKMSDIEINNLVFDAIQESPPALLWGKSRRYLDFCNNPADAWPIIVENKISIQAMGDDDVRGLWHSESRYPNNCYCFSNNPLRAAMIVFIMMKEVGND